MKSSKNQGGGAYKSNNKSMTVEIFHEIGGGEKQLKLSDNLTVEIIKVCKTVI